MLERIFTSKQTKYLILLSIYCAILYLSIPAPLAFILISVYTSLVSLYLNRITLIYLMFIYILSFGISNLGAQTGLVFGDYGYGDKLGPLLFGTPILIGTIWIIVLIGCLSISRKLSSNKVIIVLNAAMILTIFDVLIEPLASKMGYWSWDRLYPELFNFISWLVLGLIFSMIAMKFNIAFRNSLAGVNLLLFLLYLLIIVV